MARSTLTLHQMHCLVAVADTRNFRDAAERRGISQPSLSAQIKGLEDGLGSRLVERGRTGATLTPMGREVVLRARRVLEQVQAIEDFASGARQGLVGTIRLGAKPTLGPYLLPSVVERLHRRNPDLKLYIREGSPRGLERELAEGEHDVILAQLPVADSGFITRRLFREPLYLAMASDHPLAEHDQIATHALRGEKVLSLGPRFHLHDSVNALCQEFGAILLRDYEGTSLDALRQMVGMNMGVTFLPALYVSSEAPLRSEIAIRPLAGPPITRSIGLVWRRSAGRADDFEHIAQTIREVAGDKFHDLVVEG